MLTSRELLHLFLYDGRISVVSEENKREVYEGHMTTEYRLGLEAELARRNITDACFAFVSEDIAQALMDAGELLIDTYDSLPEGPIWAEGKFIWAFQRPTDFEGFALDLLEPYMAKTEWRGGRVILRGQEHFPQSICGLRQFRGLTQQQLADAAGVNVSLVRKIEGGTVAIGNITAKNLLALADALNVDPRDLISKAKAGE